MSGATVQHPGERRWETRLLLLVTATLTVFGVAAVYSAGSLSVDAWSLATNQLTGALVGGLALVFGAQFNYRAWRPLAWVVLLAVVALLIIPLLPFTHAISPVQNGARRWVNLGPVTLQPSEAARFAIVVWAAALAVKKGDRIREFWFGVLPFVVVFVVVAVLVLWQPNLSMATMLALLGAVVLFTAGAKMGQFILLGLAGGLLVYRKVMDTGYRSERFLSFLNPDASLSEAGYQVHQSLVGLGSGGLLGVGFGEGQQKLNYLPYAYSDFVFSAVGEEWGFLGALVLVLLYVAFCWVGFRIARSAPDAFGQFLATGLTAGVGLTALMHMAVNLSLLPTTGLPLPFISHGRSNLVMNLFAVGVVLSVGRQRGRVPRPPR